MSKITKKDMQLAAVSNHAPLPTKFDRSLFDQAEGEVFAGLNILKLQVGEADGPFIFKKMTPPRFLNDKYKTPIQTGVAQRCNQAGEPISGPEIQLPASAGCTGKLFDASIAFGDVFAIAREPDYLSKQGRDDCKAFVLKVFKRSGNPPAVRATQEEIDAAVESRVAELKTKKKK